eukprot:5313560-Amphidinium_carterae.1
MVNNPQEHGLHLFNQALDSKIDIKAERCQFAASGMDFHSAWTTSSPEVGTSLKATSEQARPPVESLLTTDKTNRTLPCQNVSYTSTRGAATQTQDGAP